MIGTHLYQVTSDIEFPLMSQLRVKFSPAQAADPDCLLPLDDDVI